MDRQQLLTLINSGTFQGKPVNGRLIETHISWVILSNRFAFKIKKPVKFTFLDFSTLKKRRHFCEREVALNSRLTDIYLDVIPIRSVGGVLHFGAGSGKVIDYAVRMKRLQAAKKMDHMLRHQKVGAEHIRVLASKIAAFHKNAEVVTTAFDFKKARQKFNDIRSVADWVKEHLDNNNRKVIDEAVAYSDAFLKDRKRLLTGRVFDGYHRDLHGDLHARNIFLYKDPVIFDCIEFNDAYRQIDVLSEVAFLCMDLEHNGAWELSKLFMKHYLSQYPCMTTEEQDLLMYYKCYRANVRAKVNALRAMQEGNITGQKQLKREVGKYLELMAAYQGKK